MAWRTGAVQTGDAPVLRSTLTGLAQSYTWTGTGGFKLVIAGITYNVTGMTAPSSYAMGFGQAMARVINTKLCGLGVPASCIYNGTAYVFRSTLTIEDIQAPASGTDWSANSYLKFTSQDATYKTFGVRGIEYAYTWYCHADNAWTSAPADPTGLGNTAPWYNTGKLSTSKWQARKLEPTQVTGYWWDGIQPI